MSAPSGRSISVVVVTWAGAVIALCVTRPDLAGSPTSWRADAVARAATWLLVALATAWLTIAALVWSLAFAVHGIGRLRGGVPWAPLARHALRATLAGSLAVAPPPPPATVHVGPDGRLVPVAPPTPSTTSTTVVPISPQQRLAPAPPATALPTTARSHRVQPGDNLWVIARAALARGRKHDPSDRDIAPYWLRVIAANRTKLRSGDPNLIYPGEIVELPNP